MLSFIFIYLSSIIILFPKKNEITEIINESNKHMYHLVTTEKDYLRIAHFNFSKIKFLKINLEIDNLEKLIDKILKLYD